MAMTAKTNVIGLITTLCNYLCFEHEQLPLRILKENCSFNFLNLLPISLPFKLSLVFQNFSRPKLWPPCIDRVLVRLTNVNLIYK